uniref:Non-lysosomal glucosylceramidase n=1 Tax=Acrobeloides nanus TaxID=290746 RepID=A0A914CF79_9BILA
MVIADKDSITTQQSDSENSMAMVEFPTGIGWTRRGDEEPEEDRCPFNRPKIRQVYNALPFVIRYSLFWMRYFGRREKLFINTYRPLKHNKYYGVPCGGIGCGSIGRDLRGGFCKFALRPGLVERKVDFVKADQFILNIRHKGATVKQIVLCAITDIHSNKQDSTLKTWDFSLRPENVAYVGLYPRSWTKFEIPELNITVVSRQISPVIQKEYKDSSLPTTVFVFDIINQSDKEYDVCIAFTFRNGTGNRRWHDENNCHTHSFERGAIKGMMLEHTINQMPCTYALGAKAKTGMNEAGISGFDPNGSGEEIWQDLYENGSLTMKDGHTGSEKGIAVSLSTRIAPFSTTSEPLEFALAWHMPKVHFGLNRRLLTRWYAHFFSLESSAAADIAIYALEKFDCWEKQIEAWQTPILKHPHLPDWLKSALFNELYFLTDGGSIWLQYDEEWRNQEPHLSEYTIEQLKKYGRFGYLESWEYRMINTYDVHFYASFALAELYPNLEHVIQAEMNDHIERTEEKLTKYHMEGDIAPRKVKNRVPHDLGNPAKDPWLLTNAYVMHDTGKWKDLNLKFILTSFRDYYLILKRDSKFLKFIWPSIKNLIEEALQCWDRDGDGMIENFGTADQTYDAWKMCGVSAYCGSLWLASLRVAIEMAKDIGDLATSQRYELLLESAKKAYVSKLWNGKYFNFDEGSLSQSTIMADQLCGYWYLQSIEPNLVHDLLPKEYVKSSLDAIFEYNVMKFGNGRLGAVNGMCPDGKLDQFYIQADEVWTGITYALASFYIQQGDPQRGFDLAYGCYNTCYNRSGLQYQTPEAIYRKKFYRAIGYMRPLSVWSIFHALRQHYNLLDPDSDLLEPVKMWKPYSWLNENNEPSAESS